MKFPIILFSIDGVLHPFRTYDELTCCGAKELNNHWYQTSEIIDSEGRLFRIPQVISSRRKGKSFGFSFIRVRTYTVEIAIEAVGDVPLPVFKQRVISGLRRDEEFYDEWLNVDDFVAKIQSLHSSVEVISLFIRESTG